jgi:hypothetical protein
VLMNTFSLYFWTSSIIYNKYEIVKSLGGYQLQFEFIDLISFVFSITIQNLIKVCMKCILDCHIILFSSKH